MKGKTIDRLLQVEQAALDCISATIYSNFRSTVEDAKNYGKSPCADECPEYIINPLHEQFLLECCTQFLQFMESLDEEVEIEGHAYLGEESCRTLPLSVKFNAEHKQHASETRYFQHITWMLNLGNKSVRSILPYLLTAYTCHSIKNKLVNKSSFDVLFGYGTDEMVLAQNVTRRKKQINSLSEKFSFENYDVAISRLPLRRIEELDRPIPAIANRSTPQKLYHDALFANYIFAIWFVIVKEIAASDKYQHVNDIKSIQSDISLKENYLLFLHQTKQEIPVHYNLTLKSSASKYEEQVYGDFLFTYQFISI